MPLNSSATKLYNGLKPVPRATPHDEAPRFNQSDISHHKTFYGALSPQRFNFDDGVK